MNIVCKKTKCKYNNNFSCQSKYLLISGDLDCTQYQPIEKGSLQDTSRDMMETAPEIAPFTHNKDIDINCLANCVFNKNGECMANGIFINSQTENANNKIEDLTTDDEKENIGSKTKLFCKNKKVGDEKCLAKRKAGAEKTGALNQIDNKKIEKYCVSGYDEIESFDASAHSHKVYNAKCFTFANK